MTEQTENILKTLSQLCTDLNVIGWDQPSRIYHLVEDANDPIARLAGQMPGYPPADMQAGFDAGFRCKDIHGLVVANEGYRHLHLDEVLERNPQMLERIKASAEEALGIKLEGDDIMKVVSKRYNEVMVPSLPSPGEMPPNMRAEIRVLVAMLLDGTFVTYSQSRDKEDGSGSVQGPGDIAGQNVPKAMYMFLHNVRPDPECDDPVGLVRENDTFRLMAEQFNKDA